MKQTRPLVLLKKYQSILIAAMVVEGVTFLVSLTDTIVAGNVIGADALMAIGLVAPIFTITTFLTATINSGTLLSFSDNLGAFQKKRAMEFFSQGIFLSVAIGLLLGGFLFLFKNAIISGFHVDSQIEQYISDYYNIIVFFFMLDPLSTLLDNIVVADGGERLSAVANVTQIIGNVVLSILLSTVLGVKGIALASFLCKFLFVLIISTWFLMKKHTLKLVRCFHLKDFLHIASRGVVRATTFGVTAITMHVMNMITVHYFDEAFLQVVIVVQKIIGLSAVFLGVAMAIQPLTGTLRGEGNTKAARTLLRYAVRNMIIIGGALTIALCVFAKQVFLAFGGENNEMAVYGAQAVIITSIPLALFALLVLFFVIYFLSHRYKLTLLVCAIKDFLMPVGMILLLCYFRREADSVWIGFSVSVVLSFIVCALIVRLRYGKELFPFLLPKDKDKNIFIYSFPLSITNSVEASKTAGQLLKENGYSQRLQTLVGMYIEDLLLLIMQKNEGSRKKVIAECTLILEEAGVRLILRDTGKIFDITDHDARPDSIQQYLVANMMNALETKTYLITTGYNRTELIFTE